MYHLEKTLQRFFTCNRNFMKCVKCGFCEEKIRRSYCGQCIGCMACYRGCPYEAVDKIIDKSPRKTIKVNIDGEIFEVPERITIKKALEFSGIEFYKYPIEGTLPAYCETGGCFSCEVLVNGNPMRSCINAVEDGMRIRTLLPKGYASRRIISGPSPHQVGGVGTPWWIKLRGQYVECAIWVSGCDLACRSCQNYHITYDGRSRPVSPFRAAELLTAARRRYGVDRMAISGGEPLINRRWLTEFFKKLKKLNSDKEARLHLDTNASILTTDYIDELVLDCGVTDIGPDLKGLHLETFMDITGVCDRRLAEKYLKTAWGAVKYIVDNYIDQVFIGVGIPYNRAFIGFQELREMGDKIYRIDPNIQVCLLDYFPAFRRMNMNRPTLKEMMDARSVLMESGLKIVLAQTSLGHVGP